MRYTNYWNFIFRLLRVEKKLQIKTLGRPTSHLSRTVKNRKFNSSMHNKYNWLCESAKNAFFCFSCVLYGDQNSWIKVSYKDLMHIARSAKSHEISTVHKNNVFSYFLRGRQNIQTQLGSEYRKSLIEKKKQSCGSKKVCINKNCIRFGEPLNLPCEGIMKKKESDNKCIFKELVNFNAKLELDFRHHLQQSSRTSKTIQNELLESMLRVFQEEVKQEICAADYVAVIADETTDISCQFQLVVVLSKRYTYWTFPYVVKPTWPRY